MRRALKCLSALCILALLPALFMAGCARHHLETTKFGEIVRGKYWEGLIVSIEALPHRSSDPPAWTASPNLVLGLEPALFDYIKESKNADPWIIEHLSEYKVQYWGFYHDNEKILAISFMHDSRVPDGKWKEPLGVLGGGHYFFSVMYDMGKRSFTRLSVNADS